MREIKFKRAHFKDEGKTQLSHIDEWGVWDGIFKAPSSNNFAMYFIDLQFTGLTDKSGKEIYEGYILVTAGKQGKHRWQVVFEMSSYVNGFTFKHLKGVGSKSSVHNAVWDEGVVIGNIYENPDLLKIKPQWKRTSTNQ